MKGLSLLSLVVVTSLNAPVFSQGCRLDYGQKDLSELSLSDGYRLAYLAYGSGEPLVLVHGVLSDYRDWQHLVEGLRGDYRVIALSLRASFPNAMSGASNARVADAWSDADDVIEFIERLDLGRVHLVGHSLGGAIALNIAVRRPDLLRSLVLEEPAFLVEGKRSPGMDRLFASVSEQIFRGETTAATRDFMNFVSGPGYFDSQSLDCQRMLTQNVATLSIGQPPPATTCADAGVLQTPILYVTGERSPRAASPLQACLPPHHAATISNASHGAHSDNPREYAEVVRDFVLKH